MKYSAGISGEWLSPFGALSVSAAYPINAGTFHYTGPAGSSSLGEDQTQYFQFNLAKISEKMFWFNELIPYNFTIYFYLTITEIDLTMKNENCFGF
jgi:hypothetical protein